MFLDAKKVHLNPRCEQDVYIKLPPECGAPDGTVGKLNYWLYGMRPAAAAWEKHYSELLESKGFIRGEACGVAFHHPQLDVSIAVHGDDFTLCGCKPELIQVQGWLQSWFEIKVRGTLGPDSSDDKEISILGRQVRWTDRGIEFEADHGLPRRGSSTHLEASMVDEEQKFMQKRGDTSWSSGDFVRLEA